MSRDLVYYTLLRLGLLVAIAGVLTVAGVPMLVALLIAVVLAFALSLVLFRSLRARLATDLAHARSQRRAERARLRAELRGEPGRPAHHDSGQSPSPDVTS